MKTAADDIAAVIDRLQKFEGDPIAIEESVRILDHLKIAQGLAQECQLGIELRIQVEKDAAEARATKYATAQAAKKEAEEQA